MKIKTSIIAIASALWAFTGCVFAQNSEFSFPGSVTVVKDLTTSQNNFNRGVSVTGYYFERVENVQATGIQNGFFHDGYGSAGFTIKNSSFASTGGAGVAAGAFASDSLSYPTYILEGTNYFTGLYSFSARTDVTLKGEAGYTQYLTGSMVEYAAMASSITFDTGNFEFSKYEDSALSISFSNGITVNGNTRLIFDDSVAFNTRTSSITVSGGIILKAKSISDYSDMSFSAGSTVNIDDMQLTVLLDDSFEAAAGESIVYSFGSDTYSTNPYSVSVQFANGTIVEDWVYESLGGGQSKLTFTNNIAVPEPSTYAAIFGALALAFAAYRRKKA